MTACITTQHQLFGPVDGTAALTQILPGGTWTWPGSCDTAHIAVFQPEFGIAPLKWALFRVAFLMPTGRVLFRCVTALDGPSNVMAIGGLIDSNNKPPGIGVWNTGVLITDQLNAFFAANCTQECNVGFQISGDNTNPFTLYSARLELTWQIG